MKKTISSFLSPKSTTYKTNHTKFLKNTIYSRNNCKIPSFDTNSTNYYDTCFSILKNNKDNFIDKLYLEKMNELKNQFKGNNNKKKFIKIKVIPKHNKLKLLKHRTIDEIISEVKFKDPDTSSSEEKEQKDDMDETISSFSTSKYKNQINLLKEDNLLPFIIKDNNIHKRKKELKKKSLSVDQINTKEEGKPKKNYFSIFKSIFKLLSNNGLTLQDIIKKNPFHTKPYQYIKCNRFLKNVKCSNYLMVKDLLSENKNLIFTIDYFGQTSFHWAVKLGDIKMLELLLKYGKNINIRDKKGRTPLYFAAIYNRYDVAKYLLENNSNIHIFDNFGRSPKDVCHDKKLIELFEKYIIKVYANSNYIASKLKIFKNRQKLMDERMKLEKDKNKEIEGNEEKKEL